jgi:ATP-binding cassette subfamily B protein
MVRGAFFGAALERSAGIGILILQIVILGVGGWMAFGGAISVGSLAAFYSVYLSLSYSLYYLAQYSTALINSAAGLERIEALLAEHPAVLDPPTAPDLPPLRHAIEVRGIAFIPEPGRRILDDVSLTIRAGESVALVGPSGSGKSTMLNALMRSFDPDSGTIVIDGFDLRTVSRRSFVEQSAVVFQDSFLYNASIRENVRLGRTGTTDAEIEAACHDAEIHDTIAALPNGYDTAVGERGSLLSGGQRQRIAIARALVRRPRILFLDEATSALDPGTATAVNATLERLSADRTVVSVTHRLETVVHCHRIFVFEHGRLVESGTHPELVRGNGLYASLWRKQTGLHPSEDGTHVEITTDRLRDIPLLASLDAALLDELAASQLVTENLPAGRVVVHEGDPGDKFYLIVRGRVDVLRGDAGDREQRIAILEDGDNFGELALLGNAPRSATVRTATPCIFLTLQRRQFQNLLAKSPDARAAILKQQAERVTVAF